MGLIDDVCDTGLVLGLGPLGGGQGSEPRSCSASGDHYKAKKERKPVISSSLDSPDSHEPSLTLGREADNGERMAHARKAAGEKNTAVVHRRSPHSSMSSSFCNNAYPPTGSVKRERDVGEEDERTLSSRASDEDDDSNAKKKLRLTKEQSALLEERFKEQSTLNPKQKLALAKQLNLRPRQVEVWFQNRRARTKLKQTEVDCEFLKKCCETLSDENRRLQKELQQLKALKLAAPLYMQLPAATLTMCPSCERTGEAEADSKHKEGAATASGFVVGQRPHFFNPFTHPSSSAAC